MQRSPATLELTSTEGDSLRNRTSQPRGCPAGQEMLRVVRELGAASEQDIRAAIIQMVAQPAYPCVGAKSVFRHEQAPIIIMNRLADPRAVGRLYEELVAFATAHPHLDNGQTLPTMASFLVAFQAPIPHSELDFENLLWCQLEQLHEFDQVAWDPRVSSDPRSRHFGFSVAGRAFFVIGMHPAASRLARRAPLPLLVFNLHDQFEQLRAAGHYNRLRDVVRKRDFDLQGQLNPMVTDHGSGSEARQYSGRQVADDWTPPYYCPTNTQAAR